MRLKLSNFVTSLAKGVIGLITIIFAVITSINAQTLPIDSLLVHAQDIVRDSAAFTRSIEITSQLYSERKQGFNTLQRSRLYRIQGYSHAEIGNYKRADSLLDLAINTLNNADVIPTKESLINYTRKTYSQLVQGKRKEASATIKEIYDFAMARGDTLNNQFAALLIQRGILLNNEFRLTASRQSIERAEQIIQSMQPIDSLLLIDLMTTKTASRSLNRDPHELIEELKPVIKFCRQNPMRNRSPYHRALALTSTVQLLQLLDINAALETLDEMHDLVTRYFSPKHPLMARTFMEYADAYASIGDVDRTLQYADQADFILRETPGRSFMKCTNLIYRVASFKKANKYEEAKQALYRARKIAQSDPSISALFMMSPELSLSECYLHLDQLDSAKLILDHALSTYESESFNHEFTLSSIHRLYGKYYQTIGDYDSAIIAYLRAQESTVKSFVDDHQHIGQGNFYIGHSFYLNGQLDSALHYLAISLTNFKFSQADEDKEVNPTNYPFIIPALRTQGAAHFKRYSQSNNIEELKLSLKNYEKAVEFIKKLRHYMNSQTTRQTLGELYFDVFSGAVKTAYYLFRKDPSPENLNRLFEFIQSSKAQALLENIFEVEYQNFARVPQELLKKEANLQNQITLAERLIADNPYKKEYYREKLFDANQDLHELLLEFKATYPDYYELKYENKTLTIEDAQTKLRSDEALIEYFLSDTLLYTMYITKSGVDVLMQPVKSSLHDEIKKLRNGISSYFLSPNKSSTLFKEMKSDYTMAAHSLYQFLLAPISNPPRQLTIIPDGILGYIPFETLLPEMPDSAQSYKTYPYLIRNHKLTYHYASALWHQSTAKKSRNNSLLAFAPQFSEGQDAEIAEVRTGKLLPLSGNIKEVESISKLFRGEVLTGNRATKAAFSKMVPDYGIIHFATHAVVNDDEVNHSYLALATSENGQDDHIYISDLYNINIPAELVVLSACETGIGSLKRGEGIISLARGFAYAGANAVVTSLWSVSDKATATLMQLFYEKLKEGQSKDTALQDAKLEFIGTQDESFAAPFYWASTIAIGDMKPIRRNTGLLFWVIGLLISLGLFGLIRKRLA